MGFALPKKKRALVCPGPACDTKPLGLRARHGMWDAFFCDLNYLASDLVSGKSIPVLIAVTVLPLDPNLLGTMVLLGVFLGSLATLAHAWKPPSIGLAAILTGWGSRFLNHSFAAFLSLSLLLRIVRHLYASGPSLSLLPAFCVVCQYVPERPSTTFTLLVISIGLFWLGIAHEMEALHPAGARSGAELLAENVHQSQRSLMLLPESGRRLLALHRGDRLPASRSHKHDSHEITQSFWESLGYSLIIVGLTFYAAANHGPVHSYGTGDEGNPAARRYMSVQYLYSKAYSVWPTLAAAMLRAYVYLRTAWLHGNALHLIYETTADARAVSHFCVWLHVVVLLYSAAWSCTQLTEQVLTVFVGDKTQLRMNFTVLLIAAAYLFQWRDDWLGFWLTLGVAGATVVAWAVGRA